MTMADESIPEKVSNTDLPGIITEKMQASQFIQLTGMRIVSVGDRKACVALDVTDKLLQGLGIMHGGMFGGLIDTAMGAAVLGAMGGKGRVVTVESKVNLYRPGRPGDVLTAEAEVLHLGRSTAAAEARVTNQNGQLVGHGTATFLRVTASLEPTSAERSR